MQDHAVYSIQEARGLLGGISRNTIYRLLRTGELASVVIGCRRFISPAAIAELIARSTTTTSPSLASTRSRLAAQAVLPLPLLPPVEAGLCGLGIDLMHRGFCRPMPRHARHGTSIACDSGPASPARETRRYKFNMTLAPQRGLRAWGGSWFEGRIAKCPRLQQKWSEARITVLAVIVNFCRHSAV
jgi:Helix-turn-helix domain